MNQRKPISSDSANTHETYGYGTISDLNSSYQINWKKYFFSFLRNWYWFMISLGFALGVVFFNIRYTIPQNEATAKLIIEQEENSQDMISQLRAVRYWRRQTDLANETEKITAFTTIKRAVDSVKQNVYWTGHGRIRVKPLYNCDEYNLEIIDDSANWYKEQDWYIEYQDDLVFRLYQEEGIDTVLFFDSVVNLNDWKFIIKKGIKASYDTYSFYVNDPVLLSKRYKNKIYIESEEENGTTITLKSSGPVGGREVDFLNTLCSIYILSELERKQTIAANTSFFIDEQINIILDSLRTAETQLLAFRLSNNVINLSREGEIAYERLKSFNDQTTSLKLQEDYYQYLKEYITKRNDPQTIIAPTIAGEGDELLVNAIYELQELYKERETIELSVQPNNPGIKRLNNRISSVRRRILEIINGLVENNQLTQVQIKTEEQAIINQLKMLPVNEQQLLNIKRKYDLYNQFYTFLLEKRAEAGIQKASTISNARVLDPARYDQLEPVGSDKKVIILLGLFLGLLLPAIVLILKDLIDTRIKEHDDIVSQTDIPIIGTIGHSKNSGILRVEENSLFIESLRRIRTNINFALREKEKRVLLVTSTVSGEGKSFTAANLAAVLAMNNRKVLLLGCDLRKPSLHKIFHISNEMGITSYLIGTSKKEEVIIKSSIENLYICPSGPVPPNPAELIETKKMQELIFFAKKNFDYIIIDTPPIALVADALELASYADISLYLVRQNYSHKGVINIANSMKKEEKLPKTYLIVNDIQPSKSLGLNYYYGYGRDYNYGYYNSYYGSEQ